VYLYLRNKKLWYKLYDISKNQASSVAEIACKNCFLSLLLEDLSKPAEKAESYASSMALLREKDKAKWNYDKFG
jgi:hypothetical protein